MLWKRVLVLSPHPDDGQIGCGGTVHQLSRRGVTVNHLVLAKCEENVPPGFEPSTIVKECERADRMLGFNRTEFKSFSVRRFVENRQDILQAIYDELWNKSPDRYDAVFAPWVDDLHQDHSVVALESLRATKGSAIPVIHYELPANCLGFNPNFFVELAEGDVRTKVQALGSFETQSAKRRQYFTSEYWLAQLSFRGGQIGKRHAEGFVVNKGVMLL